MIIKAFKITIFSMFCTLLVYNVSFIVDTSHKIVLGHNTIEALASSSEGGANVGKYFQIIAACGGEGMDSWIDWCCRGSEVSCIKDNCNKVVKNGCDSHGRLEL